MSQKSSRVFILVCKLFRASLLCNNVVVVVDVQSSFDKDLRDGCFSREGWHKNASSEGRLGYKLMVQTGDLNDAIDKQRVCYCYINNVYVIVI